MNSPYGFGLKLNMTCSDSFDIRSETCLTTFVVQSNGMSQFSSVDEAKGFVHPHFAAKYRALAKQSYYELVGFPLRNRLVLVH